MEIRENGYCHEGQKREREGASVGRGEEGTVLPRVSSLLALTLGNASYPIQSGVGPKIEYKLVTVTSVSLVATLGTKDHRTKREQTDVMCSLGTGG